MKAGVVSTRSLASEQFKSTKMPRATEESTTTQGLPRPPDGGYGWGIIVGGILQSVFTIPVLDMYGFLFAAKFESCKTTPTEQVGGKLEWKTFIT